MVTSSKYKRNPKDTAFSYSSVGRTGQQSSAPVDSAAPS